jgi:hypothetical protein
MGANCKTPREPRWECRRAESGRSGTSFLENNPFRRQANKGRSFRIDNRAESQGTPRVAAAGLQAFLVTRNHAGTLVVRMNRDLSVLFVFLLH